MSLTASSILVAMTLTAAPAAEPPTAAAPMTQEVLSAAMTSTPIAPTRPRITRLVAGDGTSMVKPPTLEAWMVDAPQRRPASLPVLYAALGALNVLDVYSTRRALAADAYEGNPLMRPAAIYFSERAWKKNKKGAVIVMALVNGATAAVVARNLRNAR
jgi:hypothetical protein